MATVPLEDASVDEDRGNGSWGAAGETKERHPNHRWVMTTVSTSFRACMRPFLLLSIAPIFVTPELYVIICMQGV